MPADKHLPSRRSVLVHAAIAAISLPVLQNWSGSSVFADDAAATQDAGGWTATVKPKDLVDGAFQTVKGFETKFVLARDGKKVYALSVVCTHKGGIVKASDAANPSVLVCPKHGARFDISGAVSKKPATKNLARFPIRLSDAGVVEVDTSHNVADDNKDATLTLPDDK